MRALSTVTESNRRRKKKNAANHPAQLLVNFVDNKAKDPKIVTLAVEETKCVCNNESIQNNNMTVTSLKDTVVEDNGNVLVKDLGFGNIGVAHNDNYVPDHANV